MTVATKPALTQRQPTGPEMKRKSPRSGSDWTALLVAVLIGVFIAFPFILILINSFKSPTEYANGGPLALPDSLYMDGLTAFWERVNFPRVAWNSFFIAGTVAVCGVLLSMLNAFALGIGRIRARMSIEIG